MARAGGIRVARAYVEIGLQENLARQLGVLRARLQAFGNSISALGSRMLRWGVGLGAGIGLAARQFASFEAEMAKVASMMERHSRHLAPAMAREIRKMAVEHGRAATDVARGLYDITSAQVELADRMALLNEGIRLSVAGWTDAAAATKAAISIYFAFGDQLTGIADTSDFLYQTLRLARTEFGPLAEVIGLAASQAKFAGGNLEEFGAAAAIATRAIPDMHEAATSVRSMYRVFLKHTDEAEKVARRFGVTLSTSFLRQHGLWEFFRRLREAGATEQDLAKIFPRERGLKAALAIWQNYNAALEFTERLHRRAGVAAEAYAIAQNTLTQRARRLWQAFKELGITIGEALNERLKNLTDWLREVSGNIRGFLAAHQGLIVSLFKGVGLLIATGLALKALGVLTTIAAGALTVLRTTVVVLGKALAGLSVLLKALTTPMGAAAAGVAALGVYLVATRARVKDLGEAWKDMASTMGAAWRAAVERITQGDLIGAMKALWDGISLSFERAIIYMKQAWHRFVYGLLILAEQMAARIKKFFVRELAAPVMEEVERIVNDAAASVLGIIAPYIGLSQEEFGYAIRLLNKWEKENLEDIGTWMRETIAAIDKATNASVSAYSEALGEKESKLKEATESWREKVKALLGTDEEGHRSWLVTAAEAIGNAFAQLWEKIPGVAAPAIGKMRDIKVVADGLLADMAGVEYRAAGTFRGAPTWVKRILGAAGGVDTTREIANNVGQVANDVAAIRDQLGRLDRLAFE